MKPIILGKGAFSTFEQGRSREWVITNGLGSYAGSSIIGANTRKHHGLLIASLHPPVERYVLLSKLQESVTLENCTYSFATNQRPGNYNEEGQVYLQRFIYDGTVSFVYCVEGVLITKSISYEYGHNTVAIHYSISNATSNGSINVIPFYNYRDHGERSFPADLQFEHHATSDHIFLTPAKNDNVTIDTYVSSGYIKPRSTIFDEDLILQTELDTGMTGMDCNFTPYEIEVPIKANETTEFSIICSIESDYEKDASVTIAKEKERLKALEKKAGYTDAFANDLVLGADKFIVYRQSTDYKTVLAGLPWFTDWGRDTMIALEGLTLSTKRYDDAKEILCTFAQYVKNGLVPNMFGDQGQEPLYNTVDASLWYVHAIYQYLQYVPTDEAYKWVKNDIYPKLVDIINAYKNGTDFSIYMDKDGLIHAGSGFDQVTWMDVRVGEWVVTPRHGKPVEINALWYNALCIMSKLSKHFNEDSSCYEQMASKAKESFNKEFWNEELECLYDVVDGNEKDAKIRPNQIYAVSLPFTMLPLDKAKKVVACVSRHLYANHGLRSLSPTDPEYKGIYFGALPKRDAAYHQGTCWAYPMGGFIEAYLKVNDFFDASKETARQLLAPMMDTLHDGCIGGIAEIYDGNEPNVGRGCYTQAWSVGEVLRAYLMTV